jgi:hypothetical protein
MWEHCKRPLRACTGLVASLLLLSLLLGRFGQNPQFATLCRFSQNPQFATFMVAFICKKHDEKLNE